MATEVVKSAGCPFFSRFFFPRSAQGSPALDWSEPTNRNVAISYWSDHLLPEQLLLAWQNATGHLLNYFQDVALWVHHKNPKNYPCQGVRFWGWSECRRAATVCVIDSLKDTQLCQNICTSFVFTSLGFSQVTVTVVSFSCELQATAWHRVCASAHLHLFKDHDDDKIWWKKNDSCLMDAES